MLFKLLPLLLLLLRPMLTTVLSIEMVYGCRRAHDCCITATPSLNMHAVEAAASRLERFFRGSCALAFHADTSHADGDDGDDGTTDDDDGDDDDDDGDGDGADDGADDDDVMLMLTMMVMVMVMMMMMMMMMVAMAAQIRW